MASDTNRFLNSDFEQKITKRTKRVMYARNWFSVTFVTFCKNSERIGELVWLRSLSFLL